MPENAQIDITLRVQMDRARREARQAQSMFAQIGKQAAQAGKTGASGVDRLERAIQDLHYSTVAGFDAMSDATRQFDDGLKKTRDDTDKLLKSYVDYQAIAQDIGQGAEQLGAMGRSSAMRADMAESFDRLAERANLSGDAIVTAMKKASGGTVDANTIMATSNMVLGAKFKTSSEDMAKMMSFARLKSKEYGVSVTSAFQRMTLGAVKAEVEFLDEYGITIKLNDALEMYAKKLGKSKNALKANERSQALWNALLIQADDQLAEFPDGIDKATDAYDRGDLKLLRLTESIEDFLHKSKIGPVMGVASKAVQGLTAVMTPLLIVKQMSAQASMAHAQALQVETAAMAKQAALTKTQMAAKGLAGLGDVAAAKQAGKRGGRLGRIANKIPLSKAGLAAAAVPAAAVGAAVGATYVAYKKYQDVQKKVAEGSEQAADSWDKQETALRKMVDEEKSATEIAAKYAESRRGVSAALHKEGNTLQDLTAAVVRNHVNEDELINAKREEIKEIVFLAAKAYPDYEQAMKELNDELPKGAQLTKEMSKRTFELKKALDEVGKGSDDAREKMRLYVAEFEKLSERGGLGGQVFGMAAKLGEPMIKKQTAGMRALPDAGALATETLKNMGLEADVLKAKMEALNTTTDTTTKEQKEANEAFKLITEGYGLGVIARERYDEALKAGIDGTLELTRAERMYIEAAKENLKSALDQSDATRALADASKTYGADADHVRQAQDALAVALGQTTYQEIENRKELQLLAQGLAMGTVSQERYLAAIEDVKDGTLELSAAEREAIATANLRAQATEMQADHMAELAEITSKYRDQGTQATEQYEKSREDRARQHAQRKEDIERQHRQRLEEIKRNYDRSVKDAAIARDAIGILNARETRDEELADAERARSEGQAGEDRSFNETNRSATESYQARIVEIDRMRQEELGRVRTMQAQESEALRQQQADMVAQIEEAQLAATRLAVEAEQERLASAQAAEIAKTQSAFDAAEMRVNMEQEVTLAVELENARRIASAQAAAQAMMSAYAQVANAFGGRSSAPAAQGGRGRRGARGRQMAGGGEGMVTGPATFHVGRGEREFVHFSGDQRQMSPSRMNVQGGVDLNVSSKLGEQAGPLADLLAEKLLPRIDEYLAGSVMEAFA